VAAQHRQDRGKVASGRDDHPAGAHDGLGDEGGDAARAGGADRVLELAGEAGDEGVFVLAFKGLVAGPGRAQAHDRVGQGQAEGLVEGGQAGKAGSEDGGAVVGPVPRQDQAPPRLPKSGQDFFPLSVPGPAPRSGAAPARRARRARPRRA